MYKLFLTIRYLTRKAIVIFPILVVWLCVAMLIIVTSIMGGFAERVKQTNRDFTGDIVVQSGARSGFPYYAEIQEEIGKSPDVQLSTPMIQAFCLLNTRQGNINAQVCGVRAEEHAQVTKWRETLFFQYNAQQQAVEDLSAGGFPADTAELTRRAIALKAAADARSAELTQRGEDIDAHRKITGQGFNVAWLFLAIPLALIEWLLIVLTRDAQRGWRWVWWIFPAVVMLGLIAAAILPMIPHAAGPQDEDYLNDAREQLKVVAARAIRAREFVEHVPTGHKFNSAEDLRQAILKAPSFDTLSFADQWMNRQLPASTAPSTAPAKNGVIVGVDMAYKRDRRGNFERSPWGLDLDALLIVAPMAQSRGFGSTPLTGLNAQTAKVRIIDDSYSGFFEADKTFVYADFDLVQNLALMQAAPDDENPQFIHPGRANSIEVKIKGEPTPARLAKLRDFVSDAVDRVKARHPNEFLEGDLGPQVMTWDEKQHDYIAAVVNEKNMMTFILLLMSVVVLVVVFLIFYIIVRDKTRDIGIIKAVGGSEMGVANIFTIYGGVIGILGGLAGVVTGVQFVRHTNEIHEWLYQTFGIIIWRRDIYMFDRIPDQYNASEVALYFGIAVVAGILGALIPALVAGFQNPIRALRHE